MKLQKRPKYLKIPIELFDLRNLDSEARILFAYLLTLPREGETIELSSSDSSWWLSATHKTAIKKLEELSESRLVKIVKRANGFRGKFVVELTALALALIMGTMGTTLHMPDYGTKGDPSAQNGNGILIISQRRRRKKSAKKALTQSEWQTRFGQLPAPAHLSA